jgi:hypothetical protein
MRALFPGHPGLEFAAGAGLGATFAEAAMGIGHEELAGLTGGATRPAKAGWRGRPVVQAAIAEENQKLYPARRRWARRRPSGYGGFVPGFALAKRVRPGRWPDRRFPVHRRARHGEIRPVSDDLDDRGHDGTGMTAQLLRAMVA